jgi:excinuclease UvrABC nuclease subunit
MVYSVYVFLDGNNRPYYVGKTNNMKRRRREHLKEINTGNTLPKYAVARKLRKKGVTFKMRAIRTTRNEAEAYRLERYYIKKFRRDGYCLYNCTHGGPDEIPMKIKKPKKVKTVGIVLPKKKNKKVKKKPIKKRKRVNKLRKRR